MQKYINNIITASGVPVAGASVSVALYPSGTLATIYADNGVTTKTNPTSSDALGNFSFYAADGRYTVTITGSGINTQTISDILLEDPANGTTALSSSSGASLVGYTQGGAGAVPTNVQSKLRESVSVLDFYANGISGAPVDPLGIVDSTLGIQAAINYALSSSKALFIPKGTYLVTSTISVPSISLRIYGEGMYQSIIKTPIDSNFTVLQIGAPGGTWGQYGRVDLENFGIDANRTVGAASTSSIGISCLWSAAVRLDRVKVVNTRGYGVYFYTGGYNSITRCAITAHGMIGLYLFGLNSTDSITSTLVQSNQISSCGINAVRVENFFNINLQANQFESNGAAGVGAAVKIVGGSVRNLNINGNYFEANSNCAYDIDGASIGIQGLSICDNWLAGTPATSTYNFAGATLVNAVIQDNQGGDAVATALAGINGIRSLDLLGKTVTTTSAQLTTTTTGGLSVDVCSVTLTPGTWTINGTLQIENAGGAVVAAVGIAFSTSAAQSGRQVSTSATFNPASAYQDTTNATTRLNIPFTYTTTSTVTLYMAAYLSISAGTLAYKGASTAVRIA